MSCYSELRKMQGEFIPGKIFVENGEGVLVEPTERMQACGYVAVDGATNVIGGFEEMDIGKPVALTGRVLVYVNDKENLKLGDILCVGADGNADKMTEEEIVQFPHRILGEVTEIPTYESYQVAVNDSENYKEVQVRGRVWVKLK